MYNFLYWLEWAVNVFACHISVSMQHWHSCNTVKMLKIVKFYIVETTLPQCIDNVVRKLWYNIFPDDVATLCYSLNSCNFTMSWQHCRNIILTTLWFSSNVPMYHAVKWHNLQRCGNIDTMLYQCYVNIVIYRHFPVW